MSSSLTSMKAEVNDQSGSLETTNGTSLVPAMSMEEMDPSVAGGYRVIYDRETPFELRIQDEDNTPQQIGTLEAIKVKILVQGEDTATRSVKVELSTENDLFFLYTHVCDLESFHMMQEQQKLMIDFVDYPTMLIRMLNNCIKEPHNHLAVYLMQSDGRARLDFIQNMQYKFVELLSVDFSRANDEMVRQNITFRYNSVKTRLNVLQTRLHEVNNIVKTKNPSLLLQLQKSLPCPPPVNPLNVSSPGGTKSRYLTQ